MADCTCGIPLLEGAGQHAPDCALVRADGHTAEAREWPPAEVEGVARWLAKRDLRGDGLAWVHYRDEARAVLSASGAVPRAERDKWKELALTNADEVKAWRARDPLKTESQLAAVRAALGRFVDAADWYRRCLEDVQDKRPVRGLDEAKHGYDSALNEARAALAQGQTEPCERFGTYGGSFPGGVRCRQTGEVQMERCPSCSVPGSLPERGEE